MYPNPAVDKDVVRINVEKSEEKKEEKEEAGRKWHRYVAGRPCLAVMPLPTPPRCHHASPPPAPAPAPRFCPRSYERSSQFVGRALRMPQNANLDGMKAQYKDGVLTLDVPKHETKKEEAKRITVG